MQRSLLVFNDAIKSEATRKFYNLALNKFLEWCRIKDADSLLKLDDDKIQIILEDYLRFLKTVKKEDGSLKYNPNSVPKYLIAIEKFLVMNDRELRFKKIHHMFPEKKKETGNQSYSTDQIAKIIHYTKNQRDKALIHFMASTGCRIGAIPGLKLKHLRDMELSCKAILLYAGEPEEAWAYLTPEAVTHLNEYLEKRTQDGETLKPDSPIFREQYTWAGAKPKSITLKSIEGATGRAIQRSHIVREREGIRHNIQANHGIRKWYKTKIAMTTGINPEMSKKLVQHKDLEGKYTTPTPEELFQSFKLAILNLTISNDARNQEKIKQLQDEKSDLENERELNRSLRSDVDELKLRLDLLMASKEENKK